ncbi:hypothetical protein RQP53_05135 [Paucibacter sp. APW11]|uniref:Uncharacterized protein n=1 Tax=Roseateles aquae TaxID=3077235 RepID=A0ABU3PA93_9BURK|nr:hypothetical protein [Paucibacter sp. APW11]MDT8998651.1 hypothetical protein [Paucibacter sp. APW11]
MSTRRLARRRLIALAVLGAGLRAGAAEAPGASSVEAYARTLFRDAEVQLLSTDEGAPTRRRVFGVALGPGEGSRQGRVFVLERLPGGGLRELARSQAFDFADASGRTDFEIVEAQSDRRFSLQINSRSACGVHVTVYRFAQLEAGTWVLAGMDTRTPTCGRNGELELAATRSTNFLTGQHIEQAYRNDKPAKRTVKQLAFPPFPLAGFEPFDSRHNP